MKKIYLEKFKREFTVHKKTYSSSSYHSVYIVYNKLRFGVIKNWNSIYQMYIETNEEWSKRLYPDFTVIEKFEMKEFETEKDAWDFVQNCMLGLYDWKKENEDAKKVYLEKQEAKKKAKHEASLKTAAKVRKELNRLGIKASDVYYIHDLLMSIQELEVRIGIE